MVEPARDVRQEPTGLAETEAQGRMPVEDTGEDRPRRRECRVERKADQVPQVIAVHPVGAGNVRAVNEDNTPT